MRRIDPSTDEEYLEAARDSLWEDIETDPLTAATAADMKHEEYGELVQDLLRGPTMFDAVQRSIEARCWAWVESHAPERAVKLYKESRGP
jgi:hypothetical protein